MKKYIFGLFTLASAFALTACSDFLDQMPDERTELANETEVVDLLKGAYPFYNYQYVCELTSDNLIDNNAPHLPSSPNDKQVESHYNYPSNARWNEEIFRFEPANTATYSDSDSPGEIWVSFFNSIASVNAALEAIDQIAAKQNINRREDFGLLSSRLRAAYGEAMLLRAYDHFMLANIFGQAYKNETTSANEISLPYVSEPETQLQKDYTRLSVKEMYDKIIADLEEGLKYVSDSYYDAPKYHFNTQAAHAFAARVYLFHHDWDKVIEHANVVLGTTDESLLRMCMNYAVFENCASISDYANAWQNPDLNNNLMLLDTYSTYARKIFGYRFSLAGEAASAAMMVRTNSPLWSGYIVPPMAIVGGMLFGSSSQDYGWFSSKIEERFQMLDKIAQTGYVHQIIRAFTGMNLLLERAEAYIMKNDLTNASKDLIAYWNNSFETFSDKDKDSYARYFKSLTEELLLSAYTNTESSKKVNCFDNWNFLTQNISSDITVSADAVPYMNCLNDFRRFENAFEGIRLLDLKRWGMEWTHYYGLDKTPYVMAGTDARRALEAPWEALANGAGTSRPTQEATSTNEARRSLEFPSNEKLRVKN